MSAFVRKRGIMRAIQFLMSVFVLALVPSFEGWLSFTYHCPETHPDEVVVMPVVYPFNFSQYRETRHLCDKALAVFRLKGDFSMEAKMFVTTATISTVWTIIIIGVSALVVKKHRSRLRNYYIETGMAVFLAALWLASSVTWAFAVSKMLNQIHSFDSIRIRNWDGRFHLERLHDLHTANFLPLVFSSLFGILNVFVWMEKAWHSLGRIRETKRQEGSQPEDDVDGW